MRKSSSTNFENEVKLAETCGLTYAMVLIKGRWTLNVMWSIHQGANRYGLIRDDIDGISEKMLTQRLNELEAMGLVRHHVGEGEPFRKTYALTPAGEAFVPVILALCKWGDQVRPTTNILLAT